MPIREHEQWPGQATRADRRRARRNIHLQDVGVTAATLARYRFAVSRMAPILSSVNSEMALDETIASWVERQFRAGHPLHLVGDALSGIHHFEPWTRKKLHKSCAFMAYGVALRFLAELPPLLRISPWRWPDGA